MNENKSLFPKQKGSSYPDSKESLSERFFGNLVVGKKVVTKVSMTRVGPFDCDKTSNSSEPGIEPAFRDWMASALTTIPDGATHDGTGGSEKAFLSEFCGNGFRNGLRGNAITDLSFKPCQPFRKLLCYLGIR
ncbi:hypothetical protein AVEN_124601-1 [Araneus ventricosus]|uniref:Uncharacterized protein n=1 Tax=Araneus ventricosus TaxID=182803 RepID=A0A4Y2KTP6_ARAVE|nr:hypothetical protein AVEN_124601-1 [Araneus ventricosus]